MFTAARTESPRLSRLTDGRRPGFFARLALGLRMRREIKAMRQLDDHLLDDIGMTRDLVEDPRLPKWDVPAHWRA